jgi:hypothetical protein
MEQLAKEVSAQMVFARLRRARDGAREQHCSERGDEREQGDDGGPFHGNSRRSPFSSM